MLLLYLIGKYRFLINGEAEKSMTTFLEGGHTLQEYVEVRTMLYNVLMFADIPAVLNHLY